MNSVITESKPINVLGIDIGFGITGLCYSPFPIDNPVITKLQLKERVVKWERYKLYVQSFFSDRANISLIYAADLVVIEKPFNISGNGRVLMELLGIFKREVIVAGKPLIEVPQTTLKKFATGSGKAEKSQMVKQALKEWCVEADSEDEIDAFWACLLGHCVLSPQLFSKARQDAVKKLTILK